jgi:hypothetical protein
VTMRRFASATAAGFFRFAIATSIAYLSLGSEG